MLAILYNNDEDRKPGGIGCIIYPNGEVEARKVGGEGFTIDFVDEDGGCPVSIELDDELIEAIVALYKSPALSAKIVLKERPLSPLMLQAIAKLGNEPPF